MNILAIPVVSLPAETGIAALSAYMDALPRHAIQNQPWQQYATDDRAAFAIAHNGEYVLIKYYVSESQFSAATRKVNADVHKDNCVEFFIAFGDAKEYYNIELNCLGSIKVGYGTKRTGRILLPEAEIKQMAIKASLELLTTGTDTKLEWTVFALIPKTLFRFSYISSFAGVTAKANFYKCGDGLKKPHFLSWAPINTPRPDFHRPEFFGQMEFIVG